MEITVLPLAILIHPYESEAVFDPVSHPEYVYVTTDFSISSNCLLPLHSGITSAHTLTNSSPSYGSTASTSPTYGVSLKEFRPTALKEKEFRTAAAHCPHCQRHPPPFPTAPLLAHTLVAAGFERDQHRGAEGNVSGSSVSIHCDGQSSTPPSPRPTPSREGKAGRPGECSGLANSLASCWSLVRLFRGFLSLARPL